MEALQSVLSLIVTLGILVTIHEYGHFWVARRCGVKVLRFSVGFGKPLYSWKDKQGTEFAVAAIPLGGYVKMLDEREGPVPQELQSQAFTSKTPMQRIAIAAAGPLANFMFAIAAYWLMFILGFSVVLPKIGEVIPDSPAAHAGVQENEIISTIDGEPAYSWREVIMSLVNRIGDTGEVLLITGKPDGHQSAYQLPIQNWNQESGDNDLLKGIGLHPYRPPVPPLIDVVQPNGAAARSGMMPGDLVVSIDQQPISDWYELVDIVQRSAGQELLIAVEREGVASLVDLRLVPMADPESTPRVGKIGVGVAPYSYPPELISTVRFGVGEAFTRSIDQTWSDVSMTVGAIKKMLVGLISLDNLSGPITIARVANQSISTGFEEFLRFLALLSVSLGVLNLLPIPVLDGGHILFYAIEAIRGKALSEQSQVIGFKIGLSFVLMLMVLAIYNDIMRL